MDGDEQRVEVYLRERGFHCARFTKEELRNGKTPDFRVFKDDDLGFFCEVKSSEEDQWLEGVIANAPPGDLVGGARNDPIFNRLASGIHSAYKQFDAVNPEKEYPNVLVLINHDELCGFNDFLEVFTGNFFSEDGRKHPTNKRISEGRIKEEKFCIHLYIWLDDFRPDRMFFSGSNKEHQNKLCEWFGLAPSELVFV